MRRSRRVESYARRAPTREPYDTVLIVCEGGKTEPNYFNGLRFAYRLSSANIEVVRAPRSDPMGVVRHAEQRMRGYDKTFCVFDRDKHLNFDQAVNWVHDSQAGREGRWHTITTTPCFEFWLLLHYMYSTAPIIAVGQHSACDRAVRALREYWPSYSKGNREVYDQIAPLMKTAVANGIRLKNFNTGSGSDNPATDVHILVEYLCNLKQS